MKFRFVLIAFLAIVAVVALAQSQTSAPPSYDQRIKDLESKVASLQERVQLLEDKSKLQVRPLTGTFK